MAVEQQSIPAGAPQVVAKPRFWSSSRLSETQFALLLVLPLLLVLLAIVGYPLGYSIWMSTQQIDVIFGGLEDVWDYDAMDTMTVSVADAPRQDEVL